MSLATIARPNLIHHALHNTPNTTAPLPQWCDALAATMSHLPAARSPFFSPSATGVPTQPTRLLTDRLLGTLLAVHRALPRCLVPQPPQAPSPSQSPQADDARDWRLRDGDNDGPTAPVLGGRPFPPAPYLQELAWTLAALVAAIPYPPLGAKGTTSTTSKSAAGGGSSAAPSSVAPRRRRASQLPPGALSVWEAARREMGAALALALVQLRGCLLGGDVVDAGMRACVRACVL